MPRKGSSRFKDGWCSDRKGNRASAKFFGSELRALAALDSLVDCEFCENCKDCERCIRCVECVECVDCRGVDDCYKCNELRQGRRHYADVKV